MEVHPTSLGFLERIMITDVLNYKETINRFLSKSILSKASV